MNQVVFFNETKEEIPYFDTLKKLMEFAIKKEQIEPVEFNIIFVDKDYIHELNKTYRGIDRETDVITFALEDHEDIEFADGRVLGDIYVCLEKAKEQAKEYGHSLLRELSFLCIHGFYHLLGYDHMTEAEEKVMFTKQEEVLNEYGITREKEA